jgi:hypothetical protein
MLEIEPNQNAGRWAVYLYTNKIRKFLSGLTTPHWPSCSSGTAQQYQHISGSGSGRWWRLSAEPLLTHYCSYL